MPVSPQPALTAFYLNCFFMPRKLDKQEVSDLFIEFINNYGLWYKFLDFIKEKGYTLDEMEIDEDE